MWYRTVGIDAALRSCSITSLPHNNAPSLHWQCTLNTMFSAAGRMYSQNLQTALHCTYLKVTTVDANICQHTTAPRSIFIGWLQESKPLIYPIFCWAHFSDFHCGVAGAAAVTAPLPSLIGSRLVIFSFLTPGYRLHIPQLIQPSFTI